MNNGFMVMEITEEIKDKAREISLSDCYGYGEGIPSSKFWAGENQYQNYIGNIGMFIFEDYLILNNIEYKKDRIYERRGDYFDFLINDKKIDVKTAHYGLGIDSILLFPRYKFFIAAHQKNKEVDYYVNVQLDSGLDKAGLMGFIPRDKIFDYPVIHTEAMYGAAIAIPLTDLKPIELIKEI